MFTVRPDITGGQPMPRRPTAFNPATLFRMATSQDMSRLMPTDLVGETGTTGMTMISTMEGVDPLTAPLKAGDRIRRRWPCSREVRCRPPQWPHRRQPPDHRLLQLGGVLWKNSASGLPGKGGFGPSR